VRRAAGTGLIAGWWLGRRGKNKAVKKAHTSGFEAGAASVQPQVESLQYQVAQEQRAKPSFEQPTVERPQSQVYAAKETPAVAVFERARRAKAEDRPISRVAKVAAGAVIERANRDMTRRPESAPAPRQEAAPRTAAPREQYLGKQEVLRVAKDIKVEGIRLKDMFDAGRIDEAGMRSVVNTYLRGGDIRQQLTRELVAKERSYERDPQLRHVRKEEKGETFEKQAKKASRAGDNNVEARGAYGSSQPLATTARNSVKAAGRVVVRSAKTVQNDLIDNSNTSDWIGVTAVVVLWSIILVILLS
jgi:hypothetical protein